jgi:hypothetical protein
MVDPIKSLWTRRAIISGFLAGAILAVWLAVYVSSNVRVVRLDNMYDPRYGDRVGRREEYFSRDFPTAKDIETYLFNSTLLISNPPRSSVVYYFDSDHKYTLWHANLIETGKWWSFSRWQLIRLGDQWRFATVQTFCTVSFAMLADAQQDNCYSVETPSSVFSQGRGTTREHKLGDVFNLSGRTQVPFKLPDVPITIESLLARLPAAGN